MAWAWLLGTKMTKSWRLFCLSSVPDRRAGFPASSQAMITRVQADVTQQDISWVL